MTVGASSSGDVSIFDHGGSGGRSDATGSAAASPPQTGDASVEPALIFRFSRGYRVELTAADLLMIWVLLTIVAGTVVAVDFEVLS